MKTITDCFLLMAYLVVLCFLDILCLGINIRVQDWWMVASSAVAIVICVWAIRLTYKRAKRLEEYMKKDIRSLMNLQAFALLRMTFENHPDFNPNGFGANPKDKKDEVATDK